MFDFGGRPTEIGAVLVGIAGLVISLAALTFQRRREQRDAIARRERAAKIHTDAATLEERAQARLAELEQTGIRPINLDELNVTQPPRPRSGTLWVALILAFALLAFAAALALLGRQ